MRTLTLVSIPEFNQTLTGGDLICRKVSTTPGRVVVLIVIVVVVVVALHPGIFRPYIVNLYRYIYIYLVNVQFHFFYLVLSNPCVFVADVE